MSRDQETQVTQQAQTQNQTEFNESQQAEQQAEGTVATQLSSNPYSPGGDFTASTNKVLSNTADVGSAATAEQLQQQAQRTGMNRSAPTAAAVADAQANERQLSGEEATAEQQRIASEAGYTGGVEGEEAGLATGEGSEAANNLKTGQAAAETPSFVDEFGNAAAGALGKAVVTGFTGVCWIAAELYGGWNDERAVLLRSWMSDELARSTLGWLVVSIYVQVGERTANAIHRWPWLRWVFLPIFNRALRRAKLWKGGV